MDKRGHVMPKVEIESGERLHFSKPCDSMISSAFKLRGQGPSSDRIPYAPASPLPGEDRMAGSCWIWEHLKPLHDR